MIDVLITSSSRPELLFSTVNSFLEKVKCLNHDLRFLLHEDFVNEERSNVAVSWAKNLALFSVIKKHNPFIGLGPSIGFMLQNHIKAKYMFYLQDDWVLLRELDLDLALKYMNSYKIINQIRYNKRKTMTYVGDNPKKRWMKKEMVIGDRIFTTAPHWVLNPSLWRVAFIKDKFVPAYEFCNWKTNDVLKQGKHQHEVSPEWIAENVGTFMWGGIGEPAFFQHIGHVDSSLDKTGQERKYYRGKNYRILREEDAL